MNLPLPQIEGKYEILHKIKEGGMGAIYKVRHRLLEELRVVKTIRSQFAGDPEVRERFLREAKTAIGLRHLNIAQLYDFSVDAEGTAYIVMEYIDGVTFQELLAKGGPPPVPMTMELARQALEALAYLHQRGFVHRDVAPDNLMLTRTFDGLPQVKLIDLGIAKRLESEGVDLTTTGTFLGKVRYAAPEQFSDGSDGGIGPWSDVYSFGVMLYELLTGQAPIQGQNVSEVMAGHLFRPPLAFEETDPAGRVPEDLRAIVLHALAKEPVGRIGSAEELAVRLAAHLPEPASLHEELDRTLRVTTEVLVERDEVSEPGSTQDRLAEQFGLEATPAPGPSKRPARPRRVETRAEEIAALLASAQLLAQLEEFWRARGELERLLELDPESREARELLDSVEAALRKRQAKRRRTEKAAPKAAEEPPDEQAGSEERREIAEAGERSQEVTEERRPEEELTRAVEDAARAITASIDDGNLDRADRELAFARSRYGDHPELTQAAERIDGARAAAGALRRPPGEATPLTAIRGRLSSLRRLPRWAWAVAAGLLVVAVVTLWWYLASQAAVANLGYLELDSHPSAEVVKIRDAAGDPVSLKGPIYTPVRLDLPPGRYTVSLTHETLSEPTVITVEIHAGEIISKVVDLGKPDPEEVLEKLGL